MSHETALVMTVTVISIIGGLAGGAVIGLSLAYARVQHHKRRAAEYQDHNHLMDYRAACWKARCEELRYVSFLLERGIIQPPLVSRDGSPCTFTTIDDLTK